LNLRAFDKGFEHGSRSPQALNHRVTIDEREAVLEQE
jgi:hypothetical protein